MLKDIYFTPEYGKTCEIIEDGKAVWLCWDFQEGTIVHQFIKRPINTIVDGICYYDIVTPYGYGGPIIKELKGDKEELLKAFEAKFTHYCHDNNIVSEFVRFHPLLENALDFKGLYQVQYMRHTVATNLRDFDDPFASEFSKSCRRTVKKSFQNGVTCEIIESPTDLEEFIDIYYETMDRNNAEDFYYFSKEYFDSCLKYFSNNIVLVNAKYENSIICSELYFIWDKFIHSHLSGTRTAYLRLSPDCMVMYTITQWGKERGYHFVHTGGGTTNAEDDSLYLFKKKFGKNTDFDFYIGKKIWNSCIYEKLCELRGVNETGFFPAYRSR